MTDSRSQQADELRKAGKLEEALPIYQDLARTSQQPYPFRWWIYCLRKTGRLEEAQQAGDEALARYPDNPYLRSEVGWVLYERLLKPALEGSSDDAVKVAAWKVIETNPENDFLVNRVAVAALKYTKDTDNPDWRFIARLADKVKPATLSADQRTTPDGKTYMSEMEAWYINAAHAYLEVGEYDKAHRVAQEGLARFPDQLFLIRNAAKALFHSGDAQAAAQTMRPLLNHPRCEWYVRSELAQMEMALENWEEAYRLLCQALQNRQSDQYKVGCFETMAEVCLRLEKLEEAYLHVALAKSVRAAAGWKLPDSLTRLDEDVQRAFQAAEKSLPDLPDEPAALSRLCANHWREGTIAGLPRFRGRIRQIHPDRKYTFIQPEDGGEGPIVFLRDLPRDCAREGTLVEYSLEKSFDRKKNRESFKAVHIRRLDS